MSEMPTITTPWADDPLMLPAFLGCVEWALGTPEILAGFRKSTGNNWTPGRSGLERMIDRATGVDHQFFQQFSDYVANEIFGTPETMKSWDDLSDELSPPFPTHE